MNNTVRINKIFSICIVLLFGLIIAKLIFISVSTHIDGIDIKKFALSRTTEKKTLFASRGSIYDSLGEVLAENVNSYTVIAYLSKDRTSDVDNPQHVMDINTTAELISPIIGMDKDRLIGLLSQDLYQVELGPEGRGISELVKEKIEALKLPGIDFIKETKRYYPYGSFASYVIGYAKKNDSGDIIGELGIESFYNDDLSGENGYIEYQKDAYGYKIANTPTKEIKAKNGNNVELTIDSNIEMYLENAVNDLVNNVGTSWVSVTVADAKTGAIVGSATSPTFDPNKLDITNYNSPLVSYTYEPGSTMKIFSFASSIEEGLYDGNEEYNSGTIVVDNYTIKDWNNTGWGKITFDKGFTYSSNVAATLLGQKLGKNKLMDYYTKLGFGKKTGLELYGEMDGKVNFNYNSEIATASFGQGITVTPVQIIQALTSLTNDGTIIKPYIVKKVTDSDGKVIYEGKKEEIRKVFSTSTVEKIKDLMDLTVNSEDNGVTGKMYASDEIRLIGKTGTAQYFINGVYSTGMYNIRSFAGIFPKDNPEYIIYVAIKDLNGSSTHMGSMVRNIVESIAKYKNITERNSNKDNSKIVTLGNYLNKSVSNIKEELTNLGLKTIIIGDGDIVIDQYPYKNTDIVIGSKIFLKANNKNNIMPNIDGFNKTELITLFNFMGIKYKITGDGKIISSNYSAGDEINEELIIEMGEN